MGLFKKWGSKNNLQAEGTNSASSSRGGPPPPPPTSPQKDVLTAPNKVVCCVAEQWQWLLQGALKESTGFLIAGDVSGLPTAALVGESLGDAAPSAATPSRRRRKKPASACPLRIEVIDEEGRLICASHACSEAFDGLEDKDEMFRTFQRCRCDHLELSPPSRLINWDVTKDECRNVVGEKMPTLAGNKGTKETVAVLKEPMGSQGQGIYFVRNAQEIHEIIDEHKKEAMARPNFLDELIASKGRIPSWVLQAEIRPCLMIRDRRKFHIRSYVVGVEKWETEDLVDTFLYRKHEVRIAGESVSSDQLDDSRRIEAHVTNVAQQVELLANIPELKDLQDKLEIFIAQVFAKHLVQDISRRVAMSAQDEANTHADKFVIAGLDIMVTESKRLYLLEVNVNPKIPSPDAINVDVKEHLLGFMVDLADLVVGNRSNNFVSSAAVARNHEQS